MSHRLGLIILIIGLFMSSQAEAGSVVVRKSSQPFDAFAVRDELQQQHEWQELVRQQQQLSILQSLPLSCIAVKGAFLYFNCGQHQYRPYQYQDQQLFIEIDPTQEH
ncbi:hypothetical protein K8B83_19750 [Shewanella inventionis]|uniref:Uncharacterized protein n=1 Tax=Shewanella inventionis TaxID=1738770 RepID=A0ABQ1J073_9GAMM|nr:hypothetical protein [Shewanella inventionis]MCL1158449.1 hypothetical protein [Shewanella inventionis]UAL43010.1 hypothetical protein K8B83_19750 [Shewanella inventionis]GGB56689.1 hypothetical protein GCM10011607_16610 [Shewanella inventionis]